MTIVWGGDPESTEHGFIRAAFDQARRLWREWRERRRYDAAVLTVEVKRQWM